MSNKIRLLYITHFFPPTHNAGTENYTLGLAKAFQDRGYEVEVLCAEDWDTGDKYWNGVSVDQYNGVSIRRIHLNWKKASNPNKVLFDSVLVEDWLDNYLVKESIDLVHVTSTYSLGVGVLRSVKHAGIPLVMTLMDFWFICPNHQLYRSDGSLCEGKTTAWECDKCLLDNSHLYREYKHLKLPDLFDEKIWKTLSHLSIVAKQRGMRGMLIDMDERKRILAEAILLPDIIISHSNTIKEYTCNIFSVPIEIIKYGSDLSWLENCCDKTPSDRFRIGYIGQMHKTKGVHVLIDAFLKAELGATASLYLWGDLNANPTYVEQLKNRIGSNKSIKLCGRFEHSKLGDILSSIDVLVVPSIWYENSPLVISEAFATKTPVIASNLGGMREAIVDGVDGLLFSPGDSEDLSRILKELINNPRLLNNLRSGIKPVKTIDNEATELDAIYKKLLHDKAFITV